MRIKRYGVALLSGIILMLVTKGIAYPEVIEQNQQYVKLSIVDSMTQVHYKTADNYRTSPGIESDNPLDVSSKQQIFTIGHAGQSFVRPAPIDGVSYLEANIGKTLELDGARGELVHGQVVILPVGADIKEVKWSAESLKGPDDTKIPVSIRVVGYLNVQHASSTGIPTGWWPDPLLNHLTTVDIAREDCQPLWITLNIPRNAIPGIYEGLVNISVSGIQQISAPIRLRVRNFEIPIERHFRIAADYQEGAGPFIYKDRWNEEMKWRYREFILAHRFNVHSIYQHDMHMFYHMRDESIEGLQKLHRAGQNIYFVANWTEKLTPEWYKTVDDTLKRARKAGITNKELWFYGYDEVQEDARPGMIIKAQELKKHYPKIGIMTTAGIWTPSNHRFEDLGARDGLGDLIDAWVPIDMPFADLPDVVAAARARGKQVWWYISNVPGHPYPNWFVDYPAIEARLLMGMMPWKYQPEGFLYACINSLNWDRPDHLNTRPIDDGPLCKWDPASCGNLAGNMCLFYAGVDGPISTIRFENITDGLEDYEYFWVLNRLTEKLNRSPKRFTSEGRNALYKARQCLLLPITTVETLTTYTRDPSELSRTRSAIADTIEMLLSLGFHQ